MEREILFYTYGLCTMFYAMMAWFFWRRGTDMLSRLVMVLMLIVSVSLVKDLFFLNKEISGKDWSWILMTSMDMIAEPFYAFILIELCRPGHLTYKTMMLHEAPFVLLPVMLWITRIEIFYDILVCWSAVYGLYYAVWTLMTIPKYHKMLRERFSYDENINLNWLRTILGLFFIILTLWVIDSLMVNFYLEYVYMIGTMIIWMFILSVIYRHESVISELSVAEVPSDEPAAEVTEETDEIGFRIEQLMLVERAYLVPTLKISDVARQIGSNRTYVSNWFNRNRQSTFFSYVNQLRIKHACELLNTTDMPLETIAQESGFNSKSSFYRIFKNLKGCTPNEYRDKPEKYYNA
ncbi:MAG: helix-turn-helix transcriptional regulator [Muribaculaceae bacterium]|nr:helix-turn-helix transcriptional regulator [Muribaculaceae bacterium]